MTDTFSYSINWFPMFSVQLSQIMATLQRCQKPCCWRQFFHNRGKAGDVWEEHPGRHHNECSQLWLSSNPYVQQKRPPAWNPGTMYRNQGEGVVTSVAKTPVNWYFAESPANSEHWVFIPSNCEGITQYYMKNSISMIRKNILVQLMICLNLHVKMELDSQHPGALFHLTRITPSTCSCRPRYVTSMVEIFRAESIPDPKEHDAIKNTAPNTRLDSL